VRSLRHLRVFDPEPAKAHVFAHELWTALSLPVRVEGSPEETVADADIVVVAPEGPMPHPGMLGDGVHLSALLGAGGASPALTPEITRRARVFCDDLQAIRPPDGELKAHLLGEVLSGAAVGRRSDKDVTLFASSGPAAQDLVAAWQVYQGAIHDEDIRRVELGV
jgi:ornithine cyclodeaminase/alanine dehydrogenase-like protein (mu-crystallin family)